MSQLALKEVPVGIPVFAAIGFDAGSARNDEHGSVLAATPKRIAVASACSEVDAAIYPDPGSEVAYGASASP